MSLTDAQLDRYARHIVLKEVGGEGQRRLLSASVALVGLGGIGAAAAHYLAAAGIGRLTLIDDDRVELSNLQRQTLYATADVGAPKTRAAAARIAAINPDVRTDPCPVRLTGANAEALLAGADVIVDGSDSFATRLAVGDAATRLRIPLVSASVAEFAGQLAVWRGWKAGEPCYRCLVGDDPGLPARSCAEDGVLGAMAGVIGSLAALEAIRVVVGFGDDTAAGALLRIDGLSMRFRTGRVAKDPACRGCGDVA